ncbi:MAG: VWA domain-containing protein [Kofleriaceae bacterium]|nr:VWA domain-containing protein [Kofleriaceae bacterium]
MRFAYEEILWVAAAAPVVFLLLFLYDRVQRRRLATRLGELPVLTKVMASQSPRRRVVKLVLVSLGVGLVLVAAARPQIAGKRNVELHGLDLVVAVDVSKSMLVSDVGQTLLMQEKKVAPSRLGRARELAAALIDELPGDRIGPVVFAGAASHFPVTEDHDVAVRFLYDLGPADLPPGSNLTEVFRVSRCLLRPDLYDDLGCARIGRRGHGGDPLPGESLDDKDKKDEDIVEQKVERGKAMVIFTDGGESDAEALREVATARELGIAVFVVGVGTTAGGVVYDIDFDGKPTAQAKRTPDGQTVISKRDDAGMRTLAEAAGDANRYFVASETGEVDPMPIVEALRAVNRGLATRQVDEMKDIFEPFLFAGFMLLVIEAAISTRRRRRYPEEH